MSALTRITTPTLQAPCVNHPDSSARFILGGRPQCRWCAEYTLIVAEVGAQPVQLPLLEDMLEEVRAS